MKEILWSTSTPHVALSQQCLLLLPLHSAENIYWPHFSIILPFEEYYTYNLKFCCVLFSKVHWKLWKLWYQQFILFLRLFICKTALGWRKGWGEGRDLPETEERARGQEGERATFHWFTPQMAIWPGLGQTEFRSQEIHLDFPYWCRGSWPWAIICCFLRHITVSWVESGATGIQTGAPRNASTAASISTHCTTGPSSFIFTAECSSIVWLCHYLLNHSSTEGHLSYFQSLPIIITLSFITAKEVKTIHNINWWMYKHNDINIYVMRCMAIKRKDTGIHAMIWMNPAILWWKIWVIKDLTLGKSTFKKPKR